MHRVLYSTEVCYACLALTPLASRLALMLPRSTPTSRTTALKSMLQASVSLVTTWAGQADAQAALGSALASLSTALSLAAPEPLAAAGAGGSDAGAGRRRAMSAASSGLGSADFAQAIGELSAPGRAARSSVGLQQPGVDELSFWGSQVFGAAERAVVYATTGDTQAPKGVVADVAWLEVSRAACCVSLLAGVSLTTCSLTTCRGCAEQVPRSRSPHLLPLRGRGSLDR